MDKIIEWLNNNSGCIMAILTFVYVVATILICVYNSKSAKATSEQTKELYRQFLESNRANVVPMIIVLEGQMLCLSFQNVGKSIATDVKICVNESWLKKIEITHSFSKVANALREIRKKKVVLTVNQNMCYGLCVPGNGHNDFDILKEIQLKIDISYKTLGNNYKEHYEIPLEGYSGGLINTSDYVRMMQKQITEIKNTNKELAQINVSLENNYSAKR